MHVVTPLVRSKIPSSTSVSSSPSSYPPLLFKLDNLQPSGSFKIRGLGHLCKKVIETQQVTHLVSSSGGNAGLAVAHVGKQLGVKGTCDPGENKGKRRKRKGK
jgi:L-serine/L-threonine ammonia-lyase